MAETVTISKEYFDTLLRRAEFQADGKVTIPKYEFDFLLKATQDYHTLRSALISGGIDAATLDILVNGTSEDVHPSPKKSIQQSLLPKPCSQPWSAQAAPFVPRADQHTIVSVLHGTDSSLYYDINQLPSPDTTDPDAFDRWNHDDMEPVEITESQQYGDEQNDTHNEDRSIVLKGISPFTTLADVTAVIRGGAVLNIFLRHRDRTAHVAFVEANAAEKFLIYSKRADIYVKGKRVEVFWDDCQHFLQDHLARRIYSNGATRNLIIRFVKPDMTEESIREDLDHIYRLEIVGFRFELGHALVMLNSIQQAITARSCMSSRFKYKGTRIGFAPDECSEPLPPYFRRERLPKATPQRSNKLSVTNRFASLTVEDECRSGNGVCSPVEV